ncbi:MAG: MetQ/NlpA family ABC transporter substrate-binding protein [Lachnospiraceae bacterium]|nr:MetQ/NlpA family ABC transporter substrate-binding protein [Lachnospiraceae bacterium]
MKKRILAVLCTALLAATLVGCGAKAKDDKVITVAASAVPHAEILEMAKPLLAEQGYTLEITVFDDYVQPNEVVEAGDFDCNYFQHAPYLESFNEERGTHLVSVGGIHYEPLGIYPGSESDLTALSDGATIAVPNDTTNEARALLLLQENGIITLKEDAGLLATVKDIEENPYNVKIVELESAQIARTLQDVSFGVLNGNYAMQAGLNAKTDALAYETADSTAAQTYVNIVVVKEGNEDHKDVQALVEVLKSDAITQFINDNYGGAVVPFN